MKKIFLLISVLVMIGLMMESGTSQTVVRPDNGPDAIMLPSGGGEFASVDMKSTNTPSSRVEPTDVTRSVTVVAGDEQYTSPCGTLKFGAEGDYPEIPADFFGPGSDPFDGIVYLKGQNSDGSQNAQVDVAIPRKSDAAFNPPFPVTQSVPTEISALNFQSTDPIVVTWSTGAPDSFFDVYVELNPNASSTGTMEITENDDFGGDFIYNLSVNYLIKFVDQNTGDIYMYDPASMGLSPLSYVSDASDLWTLSPIPGEFDVVVSERVVLQTTAGTTIELLPFPIRYENFLVSIDGNGMVEDYQGTGWNNSTWYVYPNFEWTNVWFYDHPIAIEREKLIDGLMIVEPRDPNMESYVEIVWNWTTPEWPGWPEVDKPPLPEDVMDPAYEESVIVRSVTLYTFSGLITEPVAIPVPWNIADYNPEWLSVDIRGNNFLLQGDFNHICWAPGDCSGEDLDFGDAPEGALAYPSLGMAGSFPTCMNVAVSGYIAHNNFGSYFGPLVDFEPDGNAGACPMFNPNSYNQDECFADSDAGLIIPDGYTIIGGVGSESVAPCAVSNGNALGYTCQNAIWGGNIDIDIHNTRPDQATVYFNVLIDWNRDGKWSGSSSCGTVMVPEHVLVDYPIPAGFDGPFSSLVPAGTGFLIGPNPGYVWARFSLTDVPVGDNWTGDGEFNDGETEDYLIEVLAEQGEIDFGDAPDDPYPTLLSNDGARHIIDGLTFLGDTVDAEGDGQPNADATGDDLNPVGAPNDEDGVTFLWPISAGNPCKVAVKASVDDAFLNAWIDFNHDGDWADAGEQIFIDKSLYAGNNFLNFIVPKGAIPGSTYARFRFSHQTGLSYIGVASDGEVEDYKIDIDEYGNIKWRQLPDEGLTALHATNNVTVADDWLCNGGAVTDIHWWGVYENNWKGTGLNQFHLSFHYDSDCIPVDPEFLGFDVPLFTIQEMNTGMVNVEGDTIYYYEFFLPEPFYQEEGQRYWLDITAFTDDPDVQWKWQMSNRWFETILCPAVDNGSGLWQPIFWPNPDPGMHCDMAFIITSDYTPQDELDYGDAPDDPYPTLLANDGARHIINPAIYMGSSIDAEPDGQPTFDAMGDDNTNLDDEDGVTFIDPYVVGDTAIVKVEVSVDGYLNAWIDYNKDGVWGPAEKIFSDEPVTAGMNTLSFVIPSGASPGMTFARFRYNTAGGLTPKGLAQNGEVEDYRILIYPPNWGFTPTGSSHLISIPVNILLNCVPLVAGDFVSTWFTDENGNLACGGATYWDGVSNQVVVAFGDDQTTTPVKEGFDEDENFLWKVYYTSAGNEHVVEVGYDNTMPDYDGKFHNNGLSALTWITDPIEVTATAIPMTLCEGDTVQLDAVVSGGCGVISYLWTSDPAGFTSSIKNPWDTPPTTTTYYVTASDGYTSDTDSITVTVINVPDLTCPDDMVVCLNDDPFTLSGAAPTGGTYSGPGVSGGVFDPIAAGVGTHTIRYTYVVAGTNCSDYCEFVIKVNPLPQMDCPATKYACEDDPEVQLTGGYPLGGEYSGTGVSFDGTDYWFDPSIGAGTYTITYCYTDSVTDCENCCEFDFVVNPLPQVDCPDDMVTCENSAPFTLTGGTPAGGTYSGPGVSGNVFDPSSVGPGVYTIEYCYTDPVTQCEGCCEFEIEVIDIPDITCPEDMEVCINDDPITLTGATPTGGTYSGPGVSGGKFYPSVAGVGTHSIVYTYVVPGTNCYDDCEFEITVHPLPNMDCPADFEICMSEPPVEVHAYPEGGTFTGTGMFFDAGHWYFDPAVGVGVYLITYCYTDPVTECENCCEFEITVYYDQLIPMDEGWNGISSYVTPDDPDIVSVMYPVEDKLIILYEYPDKYYYPAYNVNTINVWNPYKGYIVKVTDDCQLPMCGNEVYPKILSLVQGWQVIPVLTSYPVDVEALFAGVGGMVIVKDVAGTGTYWKDYNINTIGTLDPGVSYFVLMNDEGVIEFPDQADNASPGTHSSMVPVISPWNEIKQMPSSHLVAFNLNSTVFEPGDIVGGFTGNGLCAGLTEITTAGQPFALNLNADDQYTAENDGFETGEYIRYKVYRPSTGETFELEVTYNPDMNQGFFELNGLSEVTSVKMSATGIGEGTTSHISIFPNPSHGIFNIEGINETVNVKIYNAFGEEVLNNEVNLPQKLDLSNQPNGVYFIRIYSKDGVHFEKLVIN